MNNDTKTQIRIDAQARAQRMNRELKALRSQRSPLTLAAEHRLLGLRK